MARYVLGHHEFASKKAAIDEFRRILNGWPVHTELTGPEADLVGLLIHSGPTPNRPRRSARVSGRSRSA